MTVELKSTTAKVRDPERLQAVLDSYEWEFVEIDLRAEGDGWVLELEGMETFSESALWPEALPRDQWPSREQYPDEDAWSDALADLRDEKGKEGFLSLLREVGPCLETPLMAVGAARAEGYCQAQAWIVRPGDGGVETLVVVPD